MYKFFTVIFIIFWSTSITAQNLQLSDYEKAKIFMNRGQYKDAIKAFEKAKSMNRNPALIYDLAFCYDKLNQKKPAVFYFERYLLLMKDFESNIKNQAEVRLMELIETLSQKDLKEIAEQTDFAMSCKYYLLLMSRLSIEDPEPGIDPNEITNKIRMIEHQGNMKCALNNNVSSVPVILEPKNGRQEVEQLGGKSEGLLKAMELYENKEYKKAITAFLNLEEIHTNTMIYYFVANAFYNDKQFGNAVIYYERFLRRHPRFVKRSEIEARINEITKLLTKDLILNIAISADEQHDYLTAAKYYKYLLENSSKDEVDIELIKQRTTVIDAILNQKPLVEIVVLPIDAMIKVNEKYLSPQFVSGRYEIIADPGAILNIQVEKAGFKTIEKKAKVAKNGLKLHFQLQEAAASHVASWSVFGVAAATIVAGTVTAISIGAIKGAGVDGKTTDEVEDINNRIVSLNQATAGLMITGGTVAVSWAILRFVFDK